MAAAVRLPKNICDELRFLVKSIIDLYGDNIQKIILFGSFATDLYQPDSDFDICLVLNVMPCTNHDRLKMKNLADECNISREVDVVLCTNAELEYGKMVFDHIRRDGVVLYERV